MKKILIHSNAPWVNSAYGIQTKYMMSKFKEHGFGVDCYANYGLTGGIAHSGDSLVMPPLPGGDIWGRDVLPFYIEELKTDLLITLFDTWKAPDVMKQKIPVAAYAMIDHEPISEVHLSSLKEVRYVLAESQERNKELLEKGFNSFYIPHSIPTDIFYPRDKKKCREKWGFSENEFLVGFFQSNRDKFRKRWGECIEAMGEFVKEVKDLNIKLYMHTCMSPKMGGLDLYKFVKHADIDTRTYTVNQLRYSSMFSLEEMAELYSCMDCIMMLGSEGFGIPTIEAMACNVPVIGIDYATTRELIQPFKNGLLVKPLTYFTSPYPDLKFAVPAVNHVVWALEKIYKGEFKDKNIRETVMDFDLDKVYNTYWAPFFKEVFKEG